MTTLVNRREMPPKGYTYFEAAIGWRTPNDLATQGLDMVARALQQVRAQNPQAGLDPSYEACVEAICAFTCARLAQWPKLQAHFCGGEPLTEQERVQQAAAQRVAVRRGCASCGGRR